MDVLRSAEFGDLYFSADGGLAETAHVFLGGNNLPAAWAGRGDFVIAETGFGTGLNFLLTAREFLATTTPGQRLHFISFEAFPLKPEQMRAALSDWWADLGPVAEELLAAWPMGVPGWHRIVLCGGRVSVTLVIGDINTTMPEVEARVDAWYLDGFAPAKNPGMWSDTVFDGIARLSAPCATCATYSAARVVKEGLARAGFVVEKRRGFGHKRDMIVAGREGSGASVSAVRRGLKVAVFGGGIAGISAARALRMAGQAPTLFLKNGIADGGSGNPRGIFNPRVSRDFTPQAQFYAAAFSNFERMLRDPALAAAASFVPGGSLHLAVDESKTPRFSAMMESWGWGAAGEMKALPSGDASDLAGMPVPVPAFWIPRSGSLSPGALCSFLAAGLPQQEVQNFSDVDLSGFDAVVLACAAACRDWPGLSDLPLQGVRGQISMMRPTDASAPLRVNLCYGGYLSPAVSGAHVLGSTFQPWLSDLTLRDADHVDVRDKLHAALGYEVFTGADLVSGRVSFRCAAPDRFPLVGRISSDDSISVFLSTAHGSHGLLSGPMGGQLLADQMTGTPWPLPRGAVLALSPSRVRRR